VNIEVTRARVASDELLGDLNRLVPQLSASAAPLNRDALAKLVDADHVVVLMARLDGTTVGTLSLVVFDIPSGTRAWIEDVVVDEGARGKGVGEALVLAAVEEARSKGVRTIDLTSRPSREAANALYVKVGFERRETNVYRLSLDTLNAEESR